MNIIKPSFTIENIDGEQILQNIEKYGRICYKSESKITSTSAKVFIANLIRNGHESVLEHEKVTVVIVCDRGVSHEIVRHRIGSYSQECVSGETKVRKNLTIKALYNREVHGTPQDKTHNRTISLRSVNKNGTIIPNKFNSVFYAGKKKVYKVITKLGYELKCTANHRFLTNTGDYIKLKSLVVGSKVMVNGRPCLLSISDKSLKHEYIKNCLSTEEISNKYSAPQSTVRRRLKSLGVFVKRLNDKNKEKYNKNHTDKSFEKMRRTIKNQYKNGRIVWNKDIKEYENESVKKQANSLRLNHHNNGFGKENSCWNGGLKGHVEAQQIKAAIKFCELCRSKKNLEVHHKDGNEENNLEENLIKVCCSCHNLLHHGWHIGIKAIADKITSIEYVGKEDVYDIEMKTPFHNYVANGFITHNSTRYVNYNKREIEVIEPLFFEENMFKYGIWKKAMEACESAYNELIRKGSTPQEARSVLPNSLKTEIAVTYNLREWRHFFKLRTSKKAHPQMREITIPMLKQFKTLIPIVFDDINSD